MISLNTIIEGGDGNTTELIDTIADDGAIDLAAFNVDRMGIGYLNEARYV